MLLADFAVVQRVLLPDVVPQLLEAALHAPVTDGAASVEQSSHCFLQSAVLEANAKLSVPRQVFQRSHSSKRLDRVAKDDLLEVFSTNRTVFLPTQSTHASAASIADGMVTLAEGEDIGRLGTNVAHPRFGRHCSSSHFRHRERTSLEKHYTQTQAK